MNRQDCVDKGLGSRNRRGKTCAGQMLTDRQTGDAICDFHAQMRCFQEALKSVEEKTDA